MLHAQFAINDLRQKMFGSNISDLVRFSSRCFRHLSGNKHRVKEDDDWTEFFELVGDAGWKSAIKDFADRNQVELVQCKKMQNVVKLFRLDTQRQIFGNDPTATDFINTSNSKIPSHVDFPAALLHSFLFVDFAFVHMHRAEVYPAPHVALPILRFLMPLFFKFNKHKYGNSIPSLISTMKTSSARTNSLLASYQSFSSTGLPGARAADRINEGVVEDHSSFPGERGKNLPQVRIPSHHYYGSKCPFFSMTI